MGGRNGDIAIIVSQDNAAKTLTIESIDETNGSLQEVLAYSVDEIVGSALQKILPARINNLLDDYLDFENHSNDLADVLSKAKDFALVSKVGDKKPLLMRIWRHISN